MRWWWVVAAGAGLLALAGCGAGSGDGTAQVVVSLRARAAPRAAGAVAGLPADITRVAVTCTAQGMDPVSAEVPLDGTPAVLRVPAGPERVFTAAAFAGEVLRMRGTTTVDYLYPGTRVAVRIPLEDVVTIAVTPAEATVEAGGQLTLTATVEGLDDATVTWSVEDVDCGDQAGSVDAGGVYTAGSPQADCAVNVVAAVQGVEGVRASAQVSVKAAAAPQQPGIRVTPAEATVEAGGQLTLTATVEGLDDATVTWSVEDVSCGDQAGSVSENGVYTAAYPAAGCQVKVVAVSQTARAEALVTVEAATVTLQISPQAPRVLTGDQLRLTATVAGVGSQDVVWSVDGIPGGNAEVGTITAEGVYTAPPSARTVTVTATSAAVSWASASVDVAVVDSGQAGLTAVYDDGTVKQEGPVFHGWWQDCGSTANNLYQGECTPVSGSPVDWAWGSDFAVSWSGYLYAPESGTYTIGSHYWVDGRVYVKVGDTVIADLDTTGAGYSGTVDLTAGQPTAVTLRFEPNGGSNNMHLWWKPPGGDWEAVPRAYLAPTEGVSVVVFPRDATVEPGGTVSLEAVVVGTSDASLSWSVLDADGDCGGEIGTFDETTLTYTAGSPPGDCDVEVRATSQADPSAWAEALVTVDVPLSVVVEPELGVVLEGTSRRFTAAVRGGTGEVRWSLAQGDPGSVDDTGLYTAPDNVRWDGDQAFLTASLAADPSVSATAQIVLFDGWFDTDNFPSVSNPDRCSDNDAKDPVGMVSDGVSNLWVLDDDGTVFRVDVNGNVLDCFVAAGLEGKPLGLAYDSDTPDGPHLWIGTSTGKVYRFTTQGVQKAVLDLSAEGVGRADGLAWDGSHVWVSDRGQDRIFRVDPETGSVQKTLDYGAQDPNFEAIDWDPEAGKIAAASGDTVYLLDPETGDWTPVADLNGSDVDGLAVLGPYVFGCNEFYEEVEAWVLDRAGLAVNVRIIPATGARVGPGGSATFTVAVDHALDPSVTWTLTDDDGDCGTERGTFDETTLTYTAGNPAQGCDVELTATSREDDTASRTVPIRIVVVTITPDGAARPPGTEQVFSAGVTGAASTTVSWSLSDPDGDCVGEIGTFDEATLTYTAGNPSQDCEVELTARSVEVPQASASVPIAVPAASPVFGYRPLSPGYAAWAVWGTGLDDLYLVGGWGLATYDEPTAVLRSTDRGFTWTAHAIEGHAMDVWGAGQTVYVAVYGGQIEKTEDGGQSWTQLGVSLTSPLLECVWTPDGTAVFVGGRYNAYSSQYPAMIARSPDGGGTWDVVYQGSTSTRVYDLWGAGSAVYAVEAGGGTWKVLKSPDGGDTWQDVSPAGRDTCAETATFHVVGSGPDDVYVSACRQVFHTTDGGATWTEVGTEEYAYGLALADTGELYLAGGSDVFTSADAGLNWSTLGTGLTPRHVVPGAQGELAVVGFESGLTRSALWIYPDYDTDHDADGLPDLREAGTGTYQNYGATGTNSYRADTDGDGVSDFSETMAGTALEADRQPAYDVSRTTGFPADGTETLEAQLSGCDECTVTYDLPWTFPFFGTGYTRITVDDNANVWLGDRASPPAPGFDLESTGPVIAVENGDFSTYNSGSVVVYREDTDAYVTVWWQDVETKAQEGQDSDYNTFGVRLFPDGTILFLYDKLDGLGIRDAGSGISDGQGGFLSLTRALGPVYGVLQQAAPRAGTYLQFEFTPR